MRSKRGKSLLLPATDSGPRPGDFPLRSPQSRASARALLERAKEFRNDSTATIEVIFSPEKSRSISIPSPLSGLHIRFQPKQFMFDDLLERSPASWLGYGGSRGGAKSGCSRRSMVRRRLEYPGTSGQILRRVWDDVQKNHVNKIWEEFPGLFQYYRSGEHVIELPTVPVSRLFFDSAENAIDVERKGYGPEFMDIFVDQAEQFTEKELKQLKTTCRWPNTPERRCKFGLFFNPGGVGAAFLRRVFHTHEYHENEKPADFTFLQAYGWDNVEWCRAALSGDGLTENDFYSWPDKQRKEYFIERSQYGQELNRLDASMRPGHLLGEFTKFAGQYFSNWDESEHVVLLQTILSLPQWSNAPKWISIDWGFQHSTAVHWHAQLGLIDDTGTRRPLVVTYKKYIRAGLSERALAEEIIAVNDGDVIRNIFAGHDLWEKNSVGPTKEQAMSQVFVAAGLPSLKKASISRVDGWRLMHRMLDEGEWLVTDNCTEAIAAIPTAIYDPKKQNEDVLKTDDMEDDVRDSLRYGLYSQFGPSEISDEEKLRQEISHLSDPTSRAIYIQKRVADCDKAARELRMVCNRSSGRARRWQL